MRHQCPDTWINRACALIVVMVLLATIWHEEAAFALQDGTPPGEPEVVEVQDEVIAAPTDVPLPPTDVPPPPTEVPPPPPPTDVPPPPPTDVPVVPTETAIPTETTPVEPVATEKPAPTNIPAPSVTCVREGEDVGVAVGEVIQYRCDFSQGPVKPSVTILPAGWVYSLSGADDSYLDRPDVDLPVFGEANGTVRIYLKATVDAVPGGAEVHLSFRATDFTLQAPASAAILFPSLLAPTPTPTPVMDDAATLNGDAVFSLQPGESVTIPMNYAVSTERQSTTVYAELTFDETASPQPAPDARLLSSAADWRIETVPHTDTTALVPGSQFGMELRITAPSEVQTPHGVKLRLWSDASTAAGDVSAIIPFDIASIAVASSPAEPVIACSDSETVNAFTCELDAGHEGVTSAMITIAGAAGWDFSANDIPVPSSGGLLLTDLGVSGEHPVNITVRAAYSGTCADPAADHSATIQVAYTYLHTGAEEATAVLPVRANSDAPSVEINQLSFSTIDLTSSHGSIGFLVVDVTGMPTTCQWQLDVVFNEFRSSNGAISPSLMSLVDVSGVEGATASMDDGVVTVVVPPAQGDATSVTIAITTTMTLPMDVPPGGYQTTVTVQAARLQ